jgi:fructosamine-3-kinase
MMSTLSPELLQTIEARLSRHAGMEFPVKVETGPGRGQINHCVVLEHGSRRYFLKINAPERLAMYEAEQEGLRELAAARALRVPEPLFCGRAGSHSFLLMEHLDLARAGDSASLGSGLAALHQATWERFGWKMDNTIGLTPQVNTPASDWVEFWRDNRLGFQLNLAKRNGHAGPLQREGDRLMSRLHGLFDGYDPAPSLLHGDLWGGNYGYLASGTPVIYDPAVYYGDRESDLAMTELFGGFGPSFYAAYRSAWPLDHGYGARKLLYQLYHVLNHLNLFGPAYLGQAETLTRRLLAELG